MSSRPMSTGQAGGCSMANLRKHQEKRQQKIRLENGIEKVQEKLHKQHPAGRAAQTTSVQLRSEREIGRERVGGGQYRNGHHVMQNVVAFCHVFFCFFF